MKTIKPQRWLIIIWISIGLVAASFTYGVAVGLYKIFPYRQIVSMKQIVVPIGDGSSRSEHAGLLDSDAYTITTALHSLKVRKVHIPQFERLGDGVATVGHLLLVVTNKGAVLVLDDEQLTRLASDIGDVPMNFAELVASGHTTKNDFRIPWFRVNGVLAESTGPDTYLVFVSHNGYNAKTDCITQNLSRADLRSTDKGVRQLSPWKTIFTAAPCIEPEPQKIKAVAPYPGHISGGVMARFDEDSLLLAIGDYNRHGIDGTEEWAMNSNNPYGKHILVNKVSGDWIIFSTGNRNVSGLYIDENAVIWSVENGPKGGDELNAIRRNGNYGWPKVSYGTWYDDAYSLPGNQGPGSHMGYQQPVFAWTPSIAPRGITKIGNGGFRHWRGDLLVGTMTDQSIHRLRLDSQNRVVYDERIPIGHRLRGLTLTRDGRIAIVTDDGYLVMIKDADE